MNKSLSLTHHKTKRVETISGQWGLATAKAIEFLNIIALCKTLHYDAEVYPKISALVKLAQKLVTYNERN